MPNRKTRVSRIKKHSIIIEHIPIVKQMVNKLCSQLPDEVAYQDILSSALVGLIKAANRYNPARGISFKTFAYSHIKGAMFDELRSQDILSRTNRTKCDILEKNIHSLEHKLKRQPFDYEIIEELGIDIDEYHKLLEIQSTSKPISFNDPIKKNDGNDVHLHDIVYDELKTDPLTHIENSQYIDVLLEGLKSLSPFKQLIFLLYYVEELNLREIGDILSFHESRISQLLTDSIVHLREHIQPTLGR